MPHLGIKVSLYYCTIMYCAILILLLYVIVNFCAPLGAKQKSHLGTNILRKSDRFLNMISIWAHFTFFLGGGGQLLPATLIPEVPEPYIIL